MIERIWSGQSRLWILLTPFALLYGLISTLIRLSYQKGWRKRWRAPVPVVVVGNLTAGGNGKTPVVLWLVEQLQRRGVAVGVVARGYGGKTAAYPLVLDAQTAVTESGDEPLLIWRRTGAPVAVAPRRRDAVQALLARYPLDIIIADDGLQHYALMRDFEIVVMDGQRRLGNGWWLPAGPVRERPARLKQVDAVIVNGGEAHAGEIPMQLTPGKLINLKTGQRLDPQQVAPAVAMAGIGYPPRFFQTLRQLGVSLTACQPFADHQSYTLAQLQALTPQQQPLVMTEKDAVKCFAFAQENWWYLPVTATLPAPAEHALLQRLLALLPASDACR